MVLNKHQTPSSLIKWIDHMLGHQLLEVNNGNTITNAHLTPQSGGDAVHLTSVVVSDGK